MKIAPVFRLLTICLYIGLYSAPSATAEADFEERRGYWFNKEEIAQEESPFPDLGPPPSEEQLANMHPKQVEKLIEEYRQFALWKTEPEHVEWYYQLQDHARRRSLAFMNVTEYVMLRNADLNMNSEYPTNTPGQNARVLARDTALKQRLALERESAALVFLTQPGCGYCDAQRAVLKYFQDAHGWAVREIDITQDTRAVTRFGTDYTPTTIMIFRDNKDWVPVAVGAESLAKLEQSVYRSLRLARGEISPQQFTTREYQDGGMNDPQRVTRAQ